MARFTKGEVATALRALRRNKARSLLTMFGIIVGVASVVTAVAIGEGVKHQISDTTERLGRDLVTVRPGGLASGSLGDLNVFGAPSGTLTASDLAVVQKVASGGSVSPLGVVSGG